MLAVITGSNRGIGLGLVQKLKEKGYQVIALCRKSSAELKKLNVEIIEDIDIMDNEALKHACAKLGDRKVDLLINNAGIYLKDQGSSNDPQYIDTEALQKNFEINVIGSLKATLAFLPFMNESSKIIFISSIAGSIGRKDHSPKNFGYKMSKTALNMMGSILALRLKERQIAIGLIHPGYVQTDMTDHKGDISVEEATTGIMQRIDELDMQSTGQFKNFKGQTVPW